MCKAMNRSFFSVILGGFGGEVATVVGGTGEQRIPKSGSADDAAFIFGQCGNRGDCAWLRIGCGTCTTLG